MSKTTAILCLIGLLAGMTHNAWDMLTERNQFRTENRELRRDIEKLRIKQGQTPQGKA